MPPPRFVRRSSTSSFRKLSAFSANAGVASAAGVAVAAAAGEDGVRGAADALAVASGGGVADNAGGTGRGGWCLPVHQVHASKPMTQSITTIHAVRSIKLVAPAIHRAATWQPFERKFVSGPNLVRSRPTDDSAPDVLNRASPLRQWRAVRRPVAVKESR